MHLGLEERSPYWQTSSLQHYSGETAYCYDIRVSRHATVQACFGVGSRSFLGSIFYGPRI